jgi:hypothetical protein
MSGQDKSKATDKLPRERSSVQSQEQTFIHIIEACMIIILRLLNLLRTLCERLTSVIYTKEITLVHSESYQVLFEDRASSECPIPS